MSDWRCFVCMGTHSTMADIEKCHQQFEKELSQKSPDELNKMWKDAWEWAKKHPIQATKP